MKIYWHGIDANHVDVQYNALGENFVELYEGYLHCKRNVSDIFRVENLSDKEIYSHIRDDKDIFEQTFKDSNNIDICFDCKGSIIDTEKIFSESLAFLEKITYLDTEERSIILSARNIFVSDYIVTFYPMIEEETVVEQLAAAIVEKEERNRLSFSGIKYVTHDGEWLFNAIINGETIESGRTKMVDLGLYGNDCSVEDYIKSFCLSEKTQDKLNEEKDRNMNFVIKKPKSR